jgi:four helix bundle protein
MKTYKDLRVWQFGYELCLELHRDTRRFPADERFELARDLRRTSRSIIYNIGESAGRDTPGEQLNLLSIGAGSSSELEIQVMLSKDLGYLDIEKADRYLARIADIRRMLHGMIESVRKEKEVGKRTPDAGRRKPMPTRVNPREEG